MNIYLFAKVLRLPFWWNNQIFGWLAVLAHLHTDEQTSGQLKYNVGWWRDIYNLRVGLPAHFITIYTEYFFCKNSSTTIIIIACNSPLKYSKIGKFVRRFGDTTKQHSSSPAPRVFDLFLALVVWHLIRKENHKNNLKYFVYLKRINDIRLRGVSITLLFNFNLKSSAKRSLIRPLMESKDVNFAEVPTHLLLCIHVQCFRTFVEY